MLVQFGQLKGIVKVRQYTIDNFAFKLHYRLTAWIFVVATILVTSRQYIGEHIKCIADDGVKAEVIETFCFFTSTFTIPKYYDEKLLKLGVLPHPGVGPLSKDSTDEVTYHAYYQWVPFVLFLQSIMFYFPHLFWKKKEGGRLKLLAEGLRFNVITRGNSMDVNGVHITSAQEKEDKLTTIREVFVERRMLHRSWCFWMIICEILNLINVVVQGYIINKFLGGKFWGLGPKVISDGIDGNADVLERVFPKVTKCVFHKYGPSGTIQNHDAMCVMALNVINEKIYVFLWFWLLFLFICSLIAVIYRFTSMALHSKSSMFNKFIFTPYKPNRKFKGWFGILKRYNYTEWLFLSYLSSNMDPLILKDLFETLGKGLNDSDSDSDKKTLPDDHERNLEDVMSFFDRQ
nr:innexin inx7-like [Onthophagus taurus]